MPDEMDLLDTTTESVTTDHRQDVLSGLRASEGDPLEGGMSIISPQEKPQDDAPVNINPEEVEEGVEVEAGDEAASESGEKPEMTDEMFATMADALGLDPETLGLKGGGAEDDGEEPEAVSDPKPEMTPPADVSASTNPFEAPKVSIEITDEEFVRLMESREGATEVLGAKLQALADSMSQQMISSMPRQFETYAIPHLNRLMQTQEFAHNNPEAVELAAKYPDVHRQVMAQVYKANPGVDFMQVLEKGYEVLQGLTRKAEAMQNGGRKHNLQEQRGGRVAQRQGTRQAPAGDPDAAGEKTPSMRAQLMNELKQHEARQSDVMKGFEEEFGVGPF